MNAERLHAIVIALKKEMTAERISSKMQNMVNCLEALVNLSNAPNQQNLATSLDAMYAAITDNDSDRFSPAWRQILREIGGEHLFGKRLKEDIETILATNQITLAVALQKLRETLEELQKFENALNSAASAFQQLNIGDEKLQPGECEIGVLIPRQAVKNQLLGFSEELRELGFILNTFSEVATGKPSELEIKTLSSSDLLLHLLASAPYAACLAVAIERIVGLYKQLLEIRKLHQEIRKQGVPDEETTGIENYANRLMENGIDKASEEIVNDFYQGKDDGRKNELTVAVRLSMNKIANRIDHGFNLEVRVEPPAKDDSKPQSEQLQKAVAAIQSATASMQFLKLEGQPLLKLPESIGKPKKKE
jgi:hypothetical protein